jgi:diguanylate cyclase (GGDEF)-like protein
MVDAARGGRNAAALAILALSALLLTPFVFQRTIGQHRLTLTRSLDPAREAASDARLALAREVGAIRGFLLTGDTTLLVEYRTARAAQEASLFALRKLAGADSAIDADARRLENATREWNVVNDSLAKGALAPADARVRIVAQQQKYVAALDATEELDQEITNSVSELRSEVATLENRWAGASLVLAVLAATAASMVILMMRASNRQSTLARTDPLTGLSNRLGFDELARRELSRARRNQAAITLMVFDLDGFKQVNDLRGHSAGDQLLRDVGAAIRAGIREIDVAARLGGDEFAVLLPDNRANPPERAVERVRKVIADRLAADHWPVTMSVGAVTSYGEATGIDEMIHRADTLMYRVKNAGKNAVQHEMLSAGEAIVR